MSNIIRKSFQEIMKDFYVNYAYETIEERAIPNVNDGLKPVNLRILYAMYGLGVNNKATTVKCARIIGDVLGKYHPHGR